MSRMISPSWYDAVGMEAWARGMSQAFECGVAISLRDGTVLCSHGFSGDGDTRPQRFALQVNGREVGWVEFEVRGEEKDISAAAREGIRALSALAEAKNSLADLAQSNALQWVELSALYSSSSLLRGGMSPEDVASQLVDQLHQILPAGHQLLIFPSAGRESRLSAPEGKTGDFEELASWGRTITRGELIGEAEELRRMGFEGKIPEGLPILVIPLCANERCYGVLLVGKTAERLGSQHLKLASLLVSQAALAFANIELLEKTKEHERFRQELELASEIQNSILPAPEVVGAGYDVCSFCQPTMWVGGDAYILRLTGEDALIAGVADVSGHGISAALLMNAFISHLEALIKAIHHPGELLGAINDLITRRVGDMGMFITVVLLRLQTGGRVRVVDGGHPPVIIAGADGRVKALDGEGLPLGILEQQSYAERALELDVGGAILVYSDGLMEATHPDGEMFGIEGIKEIFQRTQQKGLSSKETVEAVWKEVRNFRGSEVLMDDLTIQVIRRVK